MKTLNKIFMFIISVALLSTVIGIDKVNAETGTEENIQEVPEGYTPIYDIADLYAIRNNPSGNYILMNDIDMAEATGEGGDYDCGSGWDSIETFSGVLEGNGYRIIGMQIFGCPTGFSPKYCGLFEVLSDATIQNLAMQDVNINIKMDNGYYVGAIAGRMDGSTIKNCWVSGNIELANLTQPNDLRVICAGGLVGRTTYSTGNSVIKDCYNIACITLNNIPNGTYAESSSVGGLVGCDYSGADQYTTLLQDSYNIGKISINKGNIGSLLGTENSAYQPSFIHCYYLSSTADKAFGNKTDTVNTVKLTESQMKTLKCLTGFDFNSVWEIDLYCSYPYPQLKSNRLIRVFSVKLQTPPTKLVYNQGDKLDLSGSTIEISYEDNITTTIPVSMDMVSGYDMNIIGTQTVTVSCGDAKTSFDIEVKEIPVSSVTIPKTVSIYRSKTYQMVADILPVNASDKTVIWESQDSSIVSVDDKGLLKAKAKGKTKIKVTTANGLTQECEVTVLVASAVVTLNKTEVTLKPGESVELIARITPLESTDTITWESNNAKVAEVIEGVVVAKSEGVATISAYTENGVKATCRVAVESDAVNNNTVGTTVTVDASKCKVKVLSNATTPTVEYVATTNKNATSIKIPNTVTVGNVTYKVVSIATGAFRNNKKITKVTIGSNVTTIGSSAFSGCSKLKTVSMGANVTTINAKAFYKCIALTKITIPAKVSKIGKQAFYSCKKLKSITIKTTKLTSKKVGSKAFKGIYSKATIKVPKQKLSSYKKILKAKGVGAKAKIKK